MPVNQSLNFQPDESNGIWPQTLKMNVVDSKPILSVIIPVYNGGKFIETAIQSVINQGCAIELIIIDGGSTDGSLDTIKRYASWITHITSEPDAGIYDAMNKGIDRATSKWVYFLGADDTLQPGILKEVIPYFSDDIILIYGDVLFENGWRFPSFFNARTVLQNTVHHQGAFYRHILFDDFRYNTNLRILSDYELNLIIYQRRLPVQKLPMIIARCGDGGASSEIRLSIEETNHIRRVHVSNKPLNWFLDNLLKLYYAQKKMRSLFANFFVKNPKKTHA